MDRSLPTFGIRHLRDGEPFSLLNINERQYETTLERHPQAALSYVDEDDGEKVTIGSSLELKQRLDDPPYLPAPSVTVFNTVKDKFENRFIHLFDIQQKDLCRAVWRRNQSNSVREDRQYPLKGRPSDDNDSVSHIDLNSEYHDIENDKDSVKGKTPEHLVTGHAASRDIDLMDAIPDLVDNLADLLQTTSETLRKAAAKSRTTQTSPIEDVFSGMSKVVTDVGGFGLSLLDSLSTGQLGPARKQLSPDMDASTCPTPDSLPKAKNGVKVEDHSSTISVAGRTASESDQVQPRQAKLSRNSSITNGGRCQACSTMNLNCQKISDADPVCYNCVALAQPCLNLSHSTGPPSVMDQDFGFSPSCALVTTLPKGNSILDQDSEDENADFSRRYPPLMSLRRANTVAGLHNRFVEPRNHIDIDHGLTRHNSWVKRYPHRPVPQVLDIETQRRRGFAQNCFPTQKYSPGIDLQRELPLPAPSVTLRSNAPATELTNARDTIKQQIEAITRDFPPSKDDDVSLLNNKSLFEAQNSVPTVSDSDDSTMDCLASTGKTAPSDNSTNLSTAQSSINAPPEESSGTFFHRIKRDELPKDRGLNTASEERSERQRITRPKSMYLDRPINNSNNNNNNNNPFSNLDRSHTVHLATNPASRLNRPFDPWCPTITPLAQEKSPPISSTTIASVKVLDEVSKGRVSNTVDRVSGFQRPFSPVWEDHLVTVKGIKSSGTSSVEMTHKFDRNGESSSMYSPPPRHMRSVPNLARSASMTTPTALTAAASTVNRSASTSAANATSSNLADLTTGQTLALPHVGSRLDGLTINAPPRPSNPFRMILQPTATSSVSVQTRAPPFPLTAPTNVPGPKVLPRKPVSGTRAQKISPSDRAIQECLIALRDMGYGVGDGYLQSRLHIYAEAANGDVTSAVDMIEEDKRASKRQMMDGRVSL